MNNKKRSIFGCAFCSKSFCYPNQLVRHVEFHLQVRTILQDHLYSRPPEEDPFMPDYPMKSRQKIEKSAKINKKEPLNFYTRPGLYFCPPCKRNFTTYANFQTHEEAFHEIPS